MNRVLRVLGWLGGAVLAGLVAAALILGFLQLALIATLIAI